MTIESGDPISNSGDDPNNQDVPADSNYTQPAEPYAPDLPDTGGNYEGPVGVTGIFNGNVDTGCSYDPLTHSAHRAIDDIVVPGVIGKYPLKMTRYYNSRQQYYALTAIGLSPGWAHEYSWLLRSAGHKVVSPHGSVYDDYCGAPVAVSERWEQRTDAYNGTWRLADGGKVIFVNGRVTYIDDPYGLRTTLYYDGNGQRWKVTEPGGRYLKFIYGPAADDDGTVLLTRVEAHGLGNDTVTDWVNYSYTACDPGVQNRPWKKMLTGVAYSDGTSASYEYRTDNVHEGTTTHKMYPVLQRCDDVRYNGPMRTIRYEYQNDGPHGAIINEKYPGIGAVSAIAPGVPTGGSGSIDTFTETRGDGPTRSFTYSHIHHCQGTECGPCDDYGTNGPDQQMLLSYTDFQGHTTTLGYDANWYIYSVTDANTHTTFYERDPAPNGIGQITKITHPGGAYIQYAYGSDPHYVMTITDERGNQTIHTRDANHRITRTDYRDLNNVLLAYETFTYCDQADSQCNNTFGQLKTHRLKNGAYVHYQYDGRGRLTAKWNPTWNATAQAGDPKTTYSYWTNWVWADRVYTETLPANVNGFQASEHYEYDRNPSGTACPGRGLVTKMIHADGKYQSFGYSQFGNKLWEENEIRDANGHGQRTSYGYDNYNRVLTITNPLNRAETFSYLKPGASSSYFHTTNSVYTHASRTQIVTTNVYDENFRKTSTTAAYGTALAATTSFAYDNVGNLTTVTDPRSPPAITVNTYDARNRKITSTEASGTNLASTMVWHYDGASNINKIDRPDGTSETKGYDALNRVVWDTVPQAANPVVNVTTHFAYNPSGTILQVTDPKGKVTAFQYDASDQKTSMTYPGNTQSQLWAHDNAHNLKSRTTVHNETQNFTYDNRNRKITMSWSSGVDSASYGYDDAGRLLTATNPNSTVTRTYDPVGRLIVDQQAVNGLSGGARSVNYFYDYDGKLSRMYVNGASYDYTFGYDAMGRFQTVSPTNGSVAFQYYYDAASNEIKRSNLLDNVDQIYGRDSLNRMASRYLKRSNTTFSAEVYSYDRMNRLNVVLREDGKKDLFGYYLDGEQEWAQYGVHTDSPFQEGADPDTDTTDNVDPWANYQPSTTPEAEPAPPPDDWDGPPATPPDFSQIDMTSMQRWVSYYLDRAGNRTQVVDTSVHTLYTPNNLNQYTAVTASTVNNGSEHEVSSYKGPSDAQLVNYGYINDERLSSVSSGSNTYSLAYDALGRCVKRTLNGTTTRYIYDSEKPLVEYDSTGAVAARNLYGKGIDEILMRVDVANNWTLYYQQDHEGSVTHVTNGSGGVIEMYKYDAFGAPTFYNGGGTQKSATSYNNRFLFTGREYAATYQGNYIPTFTFYEYRARAYHPTLGRFMSEDPKGFDAGDYNLFRYCHNDPEDLTDPMGTDSDIWTRTYERMQAYIHRKEMFGGGAIEIGGLRYAAQQLGGLTMGQVGLSGRQAGMQVERAIPINGQRDPLLSTRTENNLATLAQPVRDMARSLLYHARVDLHLDVRVIQGTRTYAEQNALYAQGRTASGAIVTNAPGGYSFHNFGVAFDVGIFRGRSYIEEGSGYNRVGHLGEGIGLEWGGRWRSFQDIPHFQYPGLSLSILRSRLEQGLSPIPGY